MSTSDRLPYKETILTDKPCSLNENVAEASLRGILLGVLLTLVLATANAWLALKLGILTSASIPAAIISMGVLRFFKQPTILENNVVQTVASAGEAVAGGIVYTIPALIIIGFWDGFDYFTNFFIAATGGILGVLFSIPLRRVLVHDPALKFPEGKAIAEVLKSSAGNVGVRDIFLGGIFGAVLELFQSGFKLIAGSWHYWFSAGQAVFGLGAGFAATMLGAGYMVGFAMAASIFIGAVIAWLIVLPLTSLYYPELLSQYSAQEVSSVLWNTKLRYLGIGAMLFAGLWTFMQLVRPLCQSMGNSLRKFHHKPIALSTQRTEMDVPSRFIIAGIAVMAVFLYCFFRQVFPLEQTGVQGSHANLLVVFAVAYVLLIGFLFSVITAWFSGMVGVTASPGSSVVIAGMLFAAWLLLAFIDRIVPLPFSPQQLQALEAITIIIGSVVTGIAAIANDNTQDLKVGHLVGATPWKQQLMLLLGVVVASLIIPPVMQLLFNVYGIAGVMPAEGMDINASLPAPTAALMAAVTEAVFSHSLPWNFMMMGAGIILAVLVFIRILRIHKIIKLSILGIAIGMYLPLSTTVALFLGGLIALMNDIRLKKKILDPVALEHKRQKGTLIACGLVAGAALMDVCLAIPFSLAHSPDILSLAGPGWTPWALVAGIISILVLAVWMVRD